MSRKAFLSFFSTGKGLSLPSLPLSYRLNVDRIHQMEALENSVADFHEFLEEFHLAVDLYASDSPFQGELEDLRHARLEVEKHIIDAMERCGRDFKHEPVRE